MTARIPEHAINPLFIDRWSPRAYSGERIDETTLKHFFEAARWAPSAYNAQPWRFIYALQGTPAWQTFFDLLVDANRVWAHQSAALVILVSRQQFVRPGETEPTTIHSHSFDAGAAWAQFALQATQSGWHAHALGGFDKTRAREVLGIPDDYTVEIAIAVGKRGDRETLPEALKAREQPNDRLPVSAIAHAARFGFTG